MTAQPDPADDRPGNEPEMPTIEALWPRRPPQPPREVPWWDDPNYYVETASADLDRGLVEVYARPDPAGGPGWEHALVHRYHSRGRLLLHWTGNRVLAHNPLD